MKPYLEEFNENVCSKLNKKFLEVSLISPFHNNTDGELFFMTLLL